MADAGQRARGKSRRKGTVPRLQRYRQKRDFSKTAEPTHESRAGAREVLLPIFGGTTATKESDLDFLAQRRVRASRVECMAFHPLGSARMSSDARGGVVKPSGETWAVENLFVVDGSILPTSIGVNSQLPVMGIAMMLAHGIAADFPSYAARA